MVDFSSVVTLTGGNFIFWNKIKEIWCGYVTYVSIQNYYWLKIFQNIFWGVRGRKKMGQFQLKTRDSQKRTWPVWSNPRYVHRDGPNFTNGIAVFCFLAIWTVRVVKENSSILKRHSSILG